MRVNDEVEFVSLSKKEEDIVGFTPESVKSLITLRFDKSMSHTSYHVIDNGYYVEHTKTAQNNE